MQQVITSVRDRKQLKALERELGNLVPRFVIGSHRASSFGHMCDWPIYLPIGTAWRLRHNCVFNGALNLECGEVLLTLTKIGERVQFYAGQPWRAVSCGRAVLALIMKRLGALCTPLLCPESRAALREFITEGAKLV
jgi:hypothetical protein